ncbi:Lar family restriction alleviation protein [Mesorhizobium sp. M0578]|uniref:Lar family restriction alleviation protein n=1 Tax=unclassified Mesorhizobium TaxID=325217 RepID=UPI003337ED1E
MSAIVFETSESIERCPFCGSIDLHVEGDSAPGTTVQVMCDNPECEAEGPQGENAADAIRKWNARA